MLWDTMRDMKRDYFHRNNFFQQILLHPSNIRFLCLQFLSLIFVISILFSSCKSKVQDKTPEQAQNILTVERLSLDGQTIRESNTLNAVITKKYYTVQACLAENVLSQKMDRRRVEVSGFQLRSNTTDTAGCIFWDHNFRFDYTGEGRCKVLKQVIKMPDAMAGITLDYAIDLLTDEITDLSRGKGCTVLKDENIVPNIKNTKGALILDKVNLIWSGDQEIKRSDKKNLVYNTSVSSCLRARITNDPVTNTQIQISINDMTNLNPPMIIQDLTDDEGCFDTQFLSKYPQFKYSHWMQKKLTVEIKSGPLKKEVTGTTLYLNPYEPTRTLFGYDANFDPPPMENPLKENNGIHIDGVMYVQVGNDQNQFKVNDFLGLTVSKSYQVILHPRLDLGHRFQTNRPRYVQMPDGKFRLKFMLLAPEKPDIDINEENFRDFTYITGAEKEVEVKNGVINSMMNIPVRLTDLPRLATRTVTVFKLEPVSDVGLRETLVTGFFKAKITWIKTNVFQSDVLQVKEKELEEKYLNNLSEDTKKEINKLKKQGYQGKNDEYKNPYAPQLGKSFSLSERTKNDFANLEYKRYIEGLFSQINEYQDEVIYKNPKIFEEDTSKSIFVRHLNHSYPGIQIFKTKFDEISEHATKELDVPEGTISHLYDKYRSGELKEDNKIKKAFLSIMCKETFPIPDRIQRIKQNLLNIKTNEYLRCVDNPDEFFETKFIMHSHKVNKTGTRNSNGLRIHIGSRFSTYSSENENQYFTQRVAADGTLKFPFGEFFGLGIRLYDVSLNRSHGISNGQSNSDDIGTSKEIIGEQFAIVVEGIFEKCALIRGKEYVPEDIMKTISSINNTSPLLIPRSLNQYDKRSNKVYYVCDKKDNHTFTETWYYIQDYVPSLSLLRDPFGPTEIKLIKVFRGESTLNQLKKVFEDETKTYLFTKENNTETPDIKLYENWGHLLKEPAPPAVANKLLINNFEGSFPGTVQ